ncbi:hypothetical protein SKAU_G00113830 [Synaphobranchus kaupii]|uniref:ATP synthase subunit f, mitochondrial n=1 Tax=Synaphobranchus kaupii TaxID=118154 RepID=A0A9Q1J6H8_SYNKA|nr:hypothetical protein SKAU_G00113830 [Synaphobranchus kaupii]
MSPDERSERGPMETCPFCGRSFKRLKSHIAHCKMAPVTKDTKTSKTKTWQQLSASPSAPERVSANKTTAQREGHAGGDQAHTRPGMARETKRPSLGDGTMVRQSKMAPPKGQDTPPGSGVKVRAKVQKRGGEEGAESQGEHAPAVALALSKPTGKKPGPVTTATGGRNLPYAKTAKGLLHAPGKAAGPGGESSPAKPPLKPRPPKSEQSQSLAQFPPSPRGGAVAQSSSRDSFAAPIQAVEGALQSPPHAGASGGQLSLPGDGRSWTKTSVWDHIKEGFSRRSHTPTHDHAPIYGPTPTHDHAPLHGPTPTSTHAHSQVVLVVGAGDRETAKLPMLSSTEDREPSKVGVGGSHGPPLRGTDWGEGRGTRCPLGLEGALELAAAYEGIGLSMVPVPRLAHTEHVQQKAPPTQVPAPGSQGSITDRVLMEVRLAELPVWLASRSLLTPREAAAAVHRGWRRYYRKYIDVRRGGVGGVAMLLAGYCVLSYVWSYPHLKCDRWRKYH